MKVLLVFPQQDRQTGLFIKRAFTQLGCNVEVVDAKANPKGIVPKVATFKPNLIFCSRTPSLSNPILSVKKNNKNIVTACWNVDKANSVKNFGAPLLELFNVVDLLYTVGKGNIEEYKKLCPNTQIKHLQQGCDPKTHKIENCTKQDHVKYDCDAMFAGWAKHKSFPGRANLINYVSSQPNLKFRLFSKETKNFITDAEHNKACQCAKVVLGHNRWPSISISMSVRDYKVMAAGGFLLTEYCSEMETWFDLGKECESYVTKEEALEKIKYYIAHEEERKKIAATGHASVHKQHKYIDRIKTVLKDINKIKHKQGML